MTKIESVALKAITENTDIDCMECVDIKDLVSITAIDAKILRGAISSLVKKGLVFVEEYDANGRINHFYWTAEQWANS
jgi:hypothetical protein